MAGYSGTPLAKKLGIKPDALVLLIGAPAGFPDTLTPLPEGVTIRTAARGKAPADVIVLFSDRQSDLNRRLPALVERLSQAGGLWISWPKKSSGVATDLSDGVVREIGLATGLVDNKVCAVDDTWSGLRFVRRLKDRK